MRLMTWLNYLLGRTRAILEIARCEVAVWIGLLFVLSAGFAREYDGEDLWHEPWHLAVPLVASLFTSLLLFVLVELSFGPAETGSNNGWSLGRRYRVLLSLYWLTAPLAWMYAVPVERFADAAFCVKFNLALLGIVSAWRVGLITVVVAVLYSRSRLAAFFVVMLFADSVAMVVFWLTPIPIVSFMGGVRLTESEEIVQATSLIVRFVGTVSWPVWLIGTGIAAATGSRKIPALPEPDTRLDTHGIRSVTPAMWALTCFSLLVWIPFLPSTQGEQIHRRRVETDLRAGRLQQALEYMSARTRDDFPPHWEPPPRLGYGEDDPPLIDVLIQVEQSDSPRWVREIFREKLAVQAGSDRYDYHSHRIRLHDMDDQKLEQYVGILELVPEGRAMASYHEFEIEEVIASVEFESGGLAVSPFRKALLSRILALLPDEKDAAATSAPEIRPSETTRTGNAESLRAAD